MVNYCNYWKIASGYVKIAIEHGDLVRGFSQLEN